MISCVDSSVLLDVLVDDPKFSGASEAVLRKAASEGRLIVSECVVAEIYPVFGDQDLCSEFLTDWQLDFVPSTRESALLAGQHFDRHLARGGRQGRVVADFLIASHALAQGDRLIARDRGYLRDYFKNLTVLDPSRSA